MSTRKPVETLLREEEVLIRRFRGGKLEMVDPREIELDDGD